MPEERDVHWFGLLQKLPLLRDAYLMREALLTTQPGDHSMSAQSEEPPLRPGDSVAVGDHRFIIQDYLGGGMEGHVYLVDTPQGDMVVKRFFEEGELEFNLAGYRQFQSEGVPMAKIIDHCPETRSVLMEHINAVPLVYLYYQCREQLTEAEFAALRECLRTFLDKHQNVDDFQLLVRTDTGELVLTDPH